MLVLTRREGEEIRIGDEVKVRVVGIRGDRVRIAIDAPLKIAVHRQEVYEQIAAEKARVQDVRGGGA